MNPDDMVEVPRWAVTVAKDYIEEQHTDEGEILGVLGGAVSALCKASESDRILSLAERWANENKRSP